jgi:hypothetical protein
MTFEISPGIHKIVSIALLLTLLAAAWGGVIKPLINLDEGILNELEDTYFELNRSSRLTEELERLSEDDLQKQQDSLRSLLIWADAGANQESAIQATVDKLMQSSGFSLGSLRIVNTSVHGSVSRVSVDIKGEGDEIALISLIAAIEKNQPLLIIEQMGTQVLTTMPIAGQPPAVTRLGVEFRLSGFGASLNSPPSVQTGNE